MDFDVIVIGAGISGLTAGSLLAKRGLKVGIIDKSYNPGGSCGIFKRENVIFDQGSAMLFGFGEKGFNPHRFVFNCLEEPIDVIKHELLYCVNYKGKRIKFWPDVDQFAEELGGIFPSEKDNIKRFYKDLSKLYQHVMVEKPVFSTPDETDPKATIKPLLKHPLSYAKFLSFMNKSTKSLLEKYFTDPEIFKFFDKLTSTYCYTTVAETPAILAAVMFVDNHFGGSFYPAGSTVFLPGKLEKVIEENNGRMLMKQEVVRIIFENNKPTGVELKSGEKYYARNIIYSGTVWNLYGKLIEKDYLNPEKIEWAMKQVPTYPSVVLYAYVDAQVIPEDTQPIEMLVGNPDKLDESEVTVYIPSIDDHSLCGADGHVIMAIGPSFESWATENELAYQQKKEIEKIRLLGVLEKRFPGFENGLRYAEVASPKTIERYTNKNDGAVAGPKQMLGQHMFNRMLTKTLWDSLYCCGESTAMGTGTPTVTISGLSAANAILKKLGLEEFTYRENMKNYVTIVNKPFELENQYVGYLEEERTIMNEASRCQYCEYPKCMEKTKLDIRGIMRRVTVGNFVGARKRAEGYFEADQAQELENCQSTCIQKEKTGSPVELISILKYLK
ncbi:FAD-dependent oxidoreductase [Acetobacterium bakii]|uniref:FAD-dependent oxidoreductase n=1 Tax=Acetobacterium bakii TaxID=52689 RepID=A0A0L6TZV7_9FIRM|nr:FAD-dependent oxidoreductase [Acetobacterium bakii]KNZ41778.1 FAD-dependent oxidoreductase [Acetobacterium bakii]